MLQPTKQSTTSLGKAFERHCQLLLSRQLCMDLTHVGGKGDRGIDLRGWWRLPDGRRGSPASEVGNQDARRIRVLVQCKAEKLKAGPRLIRELEGTWRQAVSEQVTLGHDLSNVRDETTSIGAVAIACTASGFSTAAAKDLARSSIPMLLLHVPLSSMTTDILTSDPHPPSDVDDCTFPFITDNGPTPNTFHPNSLSQMSNRIPIRGALWNQALSGPTGLLGPSIEIRRIFPTISTETIIKSSPSETKGSIDALENGHALNRTRRDEVYHGLGSDFGLGLFVDGREFSRREI